MQSGSQPKPEGGSYAISDVAVLCHLSAQKTMQRLVDGDFSDDTTPAAPQEPLPSVDPTPDPLQNSRYRHLKGGNREKEGAVDSSSHIFQEVDGFPGSHVTVHSPRPLQQSFSIPTIFLKPGVEFLKVSAKSARRVKSRKVWLEIGDVKYPTLCSGMDGIGLNELGLREAVSAIRDVRLCWEKSGRGVGLKREGSIPLSYIRDLRYNTSGSPYRTALHLSPTIEPRWLTIIYVLPTSASHSLLSPTASGTANYKLVHFIAPSEEVLGILKIVLENFREGRVMSNMDQKAFNKSYLREQVEDMEERVVREEDVHRLCARLGMGMSLEKVGAAFRETAAPKDYLDFSAFQLFVKRLKHRDEIVEIFSQFVDKGLGGPEAFISLQRWVEFLNDTQKLTLSLEDISKLYEKYAEPSSNRITLDGFNSFLSSSDNSPLKDDTNQDMTRPLSEYYISSSHNTYLVGSQFKGDSTIEGYIRALQQGCRCVELDVWSGDDDTPVVTHGRTFTSSIPVKDALLAIAQYGFLASTYPLILSVEIHCELAQQEKLVSIMRDTLGDRLVQERIDGHIHGDVTSLPSPWDLRGKILLKAKDTAISNSAMTNKSNALTTTLSTSPPFSSHSDSLSASTDALSSSGADSSQSSDSEFKRVFNAVRGRFGDRGQSFQTGSQPNRVAFDLRNPAVSAHSNANRSVSTQRSMESVSSSTKPSVTSPSLASLLVYTVGVKARGFNKKETYGMNHVLSFGENKLIKINKDEGVRQDFVAHNRTHLTRAYPKGIRLTSTNYLPHQWWLLGVQMVAVNWQTIDIGMSLNSAMFARAGRSGYVLKPDILRRKGIEKDREALGRKHNYTLEIEVISAQQLPRPRDTGSATLQEGTLPNIDPFVEVGLYVPGVPAPQKQRTEIVYNNAFNPVFHSSFTFPFSAHPSPGMLGLVFVRFDVLNSRGNVKAAMEDGKGDFVGFYTVSVESLMSGYRHVPLYDDLGDQHLFSSLFIKSRLID